MEQIENIKVELAKHNVFDYEIDNLIKAFSDDNLLFKKILKLIFLNKVCNHFESNVAMSDSIDLYFPRRWRLGSIKEFELATNLNTPKMILSNLRANILVVSFVIPLFCFVFLFFYKIEYMFIPLNLIGSGIYVFIATMPAILIGLVSPRFFSPLDWPDIKSIEDFFDYLVIRNWDNFRNESFSKTLSELKELIP